MSDNQRALIIAGESSGELYGSLLVNVIKNRQPSIVIKGVGGMMMKEAGVELIAEIKSAFGITEAVKSIMSLKNTLNLIKKSMDTDRPKAVILIDYPDFNFKVAQEAKKRGIPVLYYVSPQVWAWRPKRIYTLSRLADILALILPFEKAIYENLPLRTEFVGHPVLDEIENFLKSKGLDLSVINKSEFKTIMKEKINIDTNKTLIALLPGSRRHEVVSLIQPMIESALYLKRNYKDTRFIMPVAINIDKETRLFIEKIIRPIEDDLIVVEGNAISSLSASDYAIVASGTATFQCAILNVPMVVVYKVSPLTYLIGRLLVNVNHIALSNVILEKTFKQSKFAMVKELMQKDVTAQNINEEINHIINSIDYRNEIIGSFEIIRGLFLNHRASERVADLFFELIS